MTRFGVGGALYIYQGNGGTIGPGFYISNSFGGFVPGYGYGWDGWF